MLYSIDFYLICYQICMWTDVESYLFQLCYLPILCSTALTSILSGIRYACEQTWKVICFSYIVFTFFPIKCYYSVFAGHIFWHLEFLPKIIVMPGGTLCLYLNKEETTLITCRPNFIARRPFLVKKRRIKTYFPHRLPWWSPWRWVAFIKRCCTFYF